MRTDFSPRFDEEVARFALRHACEDCTFFVAERGACANGYPTATHRLRAFAPGGPRDGMFCKEFELR